MSEKLLMKGNEAIAQAAIEAGCRHFFGYPITPQNELATYMSKKMPKAGGVFLQAESEIAAVNMVMGAAAAGVRVMTSSSSPGISLKTEGLSYMAGADLPCVVVNIQRGGPGLGGIQPSQADYWQATKAPGHGDFHVLVFAPNTVQEMVDLTARAFDLADQYRMPALILGDGMLGQMMEPVSLPSGSAREPVQKSWAVTGHGGDRSKKNIVNSLYLDPAELERTVNARFERYEEIKRDHQMAEEYMTDDAEVVVVSYGAASRVVKSAVKSAREHGLKVGTIRPVTLWPFPDKAFEGLSARAVLTVEMSMGQMVDDVRLAVNGRVPVEFFGRTGGIIPTPDEVLEVIKKLYGGVR